MNADGLLESQRVRQAIRDGRITGTSRGLAPGFVQVQRRDHAEAYAFDFMLYCQRNQRACPVLEVLDPGDPVPRKLAPSADLRTDCARYSVFVDGERQEDCHRRHGSVARGSGLVPDRLRHHLRRRARTCRRADRPRPLGGAHRRCRPKPAGPFKRRPHRHHALADAAAGDHRDSGDRHAFRSIMVRRSISAIRRRIGADLDASDVRRARCRDARRQDGGVLGLRGDAAIGRGSRASCRCFIAHAAAHSFITDLPADSLMVALTMDRDNGVERRGISDESSRGSAAPVRRRRRHLHRRGGLRRARPAVCSSARR